MRMITKEQEGIIKSFTCERLSSNPQNEELIKSFVSNKGQLLVDYLQENAWKEDLSRQTAYYLIKFPGNEIALFFSLKCGALFDPLDENGIAERVKQFQELLQIIRGFNGEGHEREIAIQLLERFRSGQDIPIEQVKHKIKICAENIQNLWTALNQDKQSEENRQIIRVRNTYPGIELVHFCSNDLVKDRWSAYKMNHPLGEVLFWEYIAPIIDTVQQYVGCQYLYLFAADTSKDGSLINYYDVSLKFERPREIGTNKPSYDFCCQFMCEKISDLMKNRQAYFYNFNPDDDDVIA